MVSAKEPTNAQIDEVLTLLGGLDGEVDKLLKAHGEAQGLCKETVKRWLVARKLDAKAAARDLKTHAEWRHSFMPSGKVLEDTIKDELAQNKTFIQGYDGGSRPVTLVNVSRHKPKDAEECKRFIAYCLDCAGRLGQANQGWDGKCTGIFDLRGMTMANYDVGALRAVFDLLQNHYPERLHRLYLYCAPLIFYGLWKIVSPFVDPVTREKVVFVYEKEAAEIFARDFPPEVLPEDLGGCGQLTDVQAVYQLLAEGKEHPNMEAARKRLEAAAAASGETNGSTHAN